MVSLQETAEAFDALNNGIDTVVVVIVRQWQKMDLTCEKLWTRVIKKCN